MKKRLLSILLCTAIILGWIPSICPLRANAAVSSQWNNFRNSEYNMAITSSQTPISPQEADLLWTSKIGSGWSDAPSIQIIVDNSLIVMSGKKILKLDVKTGQIKASANMADSISYGYTPATYAEGKIFVPLGNGKVQAFDAQTLKSLWLYTDIQGGQAQSPITYSDGYIYTGFWKSNKDTTSYVCLSAADENESKADEAKTAKWTYSHEGGFYWAGSVVIGGYLIVQSDHGTTGSNGTLYVFDKSTGEVCDSKEISGDGRSSIAYDTHTDSIYFTTNGGMFYKGKLNQSTGKISCLEELALGARSTSTPVVYKGYAFIGASDKTVKMIDTNSMEIVSSITITGYPQCSLLLSNAYEASTGFVYLYSTYNAKPGGITVIKADITNEKMTSQELYDAKGFEQFCITSLICDEKGTLYYKNDSSNVFAIYNNPAYLESFTSSTGSWTRSFSSSSKDYDYEVAVAPGTESVDFQFASSQGSTVKVDDKTVEDNKFTIKLDESSKATARVVVTNGTSSRTYNISVRAAKDDTSLRVVYTNSNTITSGTVEAHNSGSTYYAFDSKFTAPRIWFDTTDVNASIDACEIVDGDAGVLANPTGSNIYKTNIFGSRYYVRSTPQGYTKLKVTCTAENGADKKDYYILVGKSEDLVSYASSISLSKSSLNLSVGEYAELTGQIQYVGTATPTETNITWTSANPSAVSVDTDGRVTAVGIGEAIITAKCGDTEAKCNVRVTAPAEEIKANVSIALSGRFAIGKDNTAICQVPIQVSDTDKDGDIDLQDVLKEVHEKYYNGTEDGYGFADWGSYGIYIRELWGEDASASGYYINDQYVNGDLTTKVNDKDKIVFYTYRDTSAWSDVYTYFTQNKFVGRDNAVISLKGTSYNETGFGVSGAQIKLYDSDGSELSGNSHRLKDNGDGTYTISNIADGEYIVYAYSSEDKIIVPARCAIKIGEDKTEEVGQKPEGNIIEDEKNNDKAESSNNQEGTLENIMTNDSNNTAVLICLLLVSLAIIAVINAWRKSTKIFK